MIKHLLLFGASMIPCSMLATDFFITPEGNGTKDGSTWENAMGLPEYYAHMKFYFKANGDIPKTEVNDAHTGETYFFSTGKYTFNQTVFICRSGVTFKGGYDPSTGLPAESGRTVFDGVNQGRTNGALFICDNTELNSTNVTNRAVYIDNIDFENFITKGEWKNDDTNWQPGRPSAIYIWFSGHVEITGCNFRNNICQGTGGNAMAGALSLNKVNCLVRDCSFTGNEGTDGGAIKVYYNTEGNWSKMSKLVVDRCMFSGNKSSNCGGAIYGRNAQVVNIINSTIIGNEAPEGGAIYMNDKGNYDNALNIVSSTIAGNISTGGEQIFTKTVAMLKVANSIIVSSEDAPAISGATSTSDYIFQGNNLIGNVADGYSKAEIDDISAANNYQTVFGSNVLAEDGTLTPVKFKEGMAADDIASIVAAESWNFSVDCAVDQLGDTRTAGTSNGALAVVNTNTGVDDVISDKTVTDESWYNLQGMKLKECPTEKGIYIHKGKKVLVL